MRVCGGGWVGGGGGRRGREGGRVGAVQRGLGARSNREGRSSGDRDGRRRGPVGEWGTRIGRCGPARIRKSGGGKGRSCGEGKGL